MVMPLMAALSAGDVLASQTQVHAVSGSGLFAGELEGAGVTGDFAVIPGPETRAMVASLPGAVLAIARAGDGQLYVATGAPGRVYRVNGSAAEEVYSADKPLVTGLFAVGKDKLVALVAPDVGAVVIDVKTKATEVISAPAKLLLGGAVHNDTVYAVGSTDDGGVVLSLAPGKKAFEVAATTKEPLRSVAARTVAGKLKLVVGGAEEGVVYAVEGKSVRALLDASAQETVAVAIADSGAVLAAFVDSDGKLQKAANAKAKSDDDDEGGSKKPTKARKVKGGEVWRIEPSGAVRQLFHSKVHGPYALAIDAERGRALVGTGPQGRLYSLPLTGTARASVVTRKKGTDELTALFVEKAGVVVGAAHGGSVVFVGANQVTSSWLSPALSAEARARYGLARVVVDKGAARVSLRTGNTGDPEDGSWGPWSAPQPASAVGVVVAVEPALYAQLKVELGAGAMVSAAHLTYLVENRAPEVVSLDVLAPGWRVIANQRQPPESRSVTFNEKAFAKFLDRAGAQNPTMDERPFGKQTFDVGYRTVYAYVEDADKDALRYRFFLGKQQGTAPPTAWRPLGDWSEEPFASFEASRLADGEYRVKVEVNDSLTNGPARALSDSLVSTSFTVSHATPTVTSTSAARGTGGARVQLTVQGALPLISVRCSTDLQEWLPLDPKDGLLDAAKESFDMTLPATAQADTVSCEVYDEALSFTRVDIPLK